MEARLFTLVNAEDDTEIFAWGMEITDDDDTEAVIYRRDPETGRPTFGVHTSAESALRLYTRIAPMDLVWEDAEPDYAELLEPDPVVPEPVGAVG